MQVPLSLISEAKELVVIAEGTGGSAASAETLLYLKERSSKLHKAICDERRRTSAGDSAASQPSTSSRPSQPGTLLSTESIMSEILQEQRAVLKSLNDIAVSPALHPQYFGTLPG